LQENDENINYDIKCLIIRIKQNVILICHGSNKTHRTYSDVNFHMLTDFENSFTNGKATQF